MTRATTSGRTIHASNEGPPQNCIALAGKGVPGSADLEDAIEAVTRAAGTLREATRRRGREWKPGEPAVRLRSPAGVRGGAGWTVLIAVPEFVTARDVRAASEKAARHHEVAKNIRLVPLQIAATRTLPPRPGRDRLQGQLRRSRSGSPQHRARDMR